VPEVPVHLQTKPELRRVFEHPRKTNCGFCRDSPLAFDDQVDANVLRFRVADPEFGGMYSSNQAYVSRMVSSSGRAT